MTKNSKLVLALALAAMMIVSMIPAMADAANYPATGDHNFTITIKPNIKDNGTHKYDAYQIFAGDLSQTEGTAADQNNIDGTKVNTTATNKKLSNITWGSAITNTTGLEGALKAVAPFSSLAATATPTDFANALSTATKEQVQQFADIVSTYAVNKANATTATGNKETNAVITVTRPGYYLVKETIEAASSDSARPAAYSDFILQVVDNVTVTAKSSVPSVEKKVKEVGRTANDASAIVDGMKLGEGFNDVADYAVGDTIDYEIFGTVADNYADYTVYAYKFTDTLDTGLDFVTAQADITVQYSNDNGTTWTDMPTTNMTKTIAGKVLTVEFPTEKSGDAYTKKGLKDYAETVIKAGTVIKVTYQAKLNKDAVVGTPGNPNTVKITFSNNPNKGGEGETADSPEDKVIVFTYELDADKFADKSRAEGGTALSGASFILKNSEGKVLMASSYTSEDLTTVTWSTIAAPSSDADKAVPVTYYTTAGAKVFTSNVAGSIMKVDGLEDGTYTIVEIEAPAGYSLASDTKVEIIATTNNGQTWTDFNANSALTKFEYKINDAATATEGTISDAKAQADIIDLSGATLPSTGGVGTTIFYVAGSIMVLAAAILLITKRRMGAND